MDTATEDLLTLMQWMSPSFPVGAFSYSHGLEWAIETTQVRDADTLERWVSDVLQFGSGASDARFLSAAYHAQDKRTVLEIDALCRAYAPSRERLKETVLQGEAFCQTASSIWELGLENLTYPVAVGTAAAGRMLPLKHTSAAFLHAFTSNLVSVGMRLIPLGQTDGQRLINRLAPLCAEIARLEREGDLDRLSSTAFLTDIASMKHETQYSRSFRT
jgi:urease accessory protein